MGLVLTDEQQMLAESARDFLEAKAPLSTVRKLRDANPDAGFDRELWGEMVAMGWSGIHLPEAHGGLAFGFQGLSLVMEETGRTLTASPLLSTVVLGAGAIMAGGDDTQQAALLPKIAGGEILMALAVDEGRHHAPHTVETQITWTPSGAVLSGTKTLVVDGHVADQFIVSARAGQNGEGDGSLTLFLCPADAPGITVTRLKAVDMRNAAIVEFDKVPVSKLEMLGQDGHGAGLLDQVLDQGRVALAAEMLGASQNAFDITLEYMKTRVQFGQPIGQFQALQHRAAQMFAELEQLRAVVLEAATAIEAGPAKAALTASLAKARANDVFHLVSREAIQLHGGIGMTDDYDIGFYIKRSAVTEQLFGASAFHRNRYATLMGF